MSQVTNAGRGDTSWFVHDRFGMFIHWGLYAMPARHEWVKQRERSRDEAYQPYFDHFDPDLYDPEAWADAAQSAGMKYAVITTKHHEGFCLWDSALTDYKAPNTLAGRDLLRPFVDAFRARDMRVGFYHSLIDWHHPDFPVDGIHSQRDDEEFKAQHADRDVTRYAEYLHGQTRELLEGYGPVDIMWFDFSYPDRVWGGKGRNEWQSEKLHSIVREIAPNIILNDRLDLPGTADVVTPEQYQPRAWMESNGERVVWEACQTLNGSWGYDRDNLDWKPVDLLVRMLVDSVSKGGNLLLNVGPNGRGEFEPRALETLRGIGEWMRLHKRSIQGCTASEFTPPPDGRYTQNGDRLYLHLFAWPFRHVHLEGLEGKIKYAQLLNDASEIKHTELDPHQQAQNTSMSGAPGVTTLELPVQRPNTAVPVIEIFLKS